MTYDHETGPGWWTRVLTIRFRRWTFSFAVDRNRDERPPSHDIEAIVDGIVERYEDALRRLGDS